MPLSAAERMTMQKPVQTQAATTMSQMVLSGASWRNVTGWPPRAVTPALSRPVCGCPGGW